MPAIKAVLTGGSSPRVRGTRGGNIQGRAIFRFIPACAGNTAADPRCRTGYPVHPRVCGEHAVPASDVVLTSGSSPRVRGTLARDPGGHRLRRFIPACAGNTVLFAAARGRKSVHPRVCGEHCGSGGRRPQHSGSSPRVRGTPNEQRVGVDLLRFIPACAGNTMLVRFHAGATPVHPRVCGEHVIAPVNDKHVTGSSPRVRGTLDARLPSDYVTRFIPACAGNTSRL